MKSNYKIQRTPELWSASPDNVIADLGYHRIPLIKVSDSIATLRLKPIKLSFAQIGGDEIIIFPGEHINGFLHNKARFEVYDSASINYKLEEITKGFYKIRSYYNIGSDFKTFKSIAALLIQYTDSTKNALSNQVHSWKDKNVTIALKEYLSTLLAHYLVLPTLFKNPYNQEELVGIIRKNIKIMYPEYWLQVQSGRIFLKNYYRKIALPMADYNLQKSLTDRFFMYPAIEKLVSYQYFLECKEKGTVKTKTQLSDDWKQINSKLAFSKPEQELMQDVYKEIQKIGEKISDVFATLPLMNADGKMLNDVEKEALIAHPNIILDFWA